jgi:hypothetical protein
MVRHLFRALCLTPVALGAFVVSAQAQTAPSETMNQVITYGENTGSTRIGQVTSVSQLSDVKPTDWAFQALQSLVERYGCIVGYPDKTFRGNRAMTRYEFAAGLNACMDRVNELIAAGTADLVKKDDLDALKRMQDEFRAELDELRGKVDGLEARTATLERQQFSTTTKLAGEVIFGLAGVLGDDRALNSDQQRAIDATTTAAARTAAEAAAFGAGTRDVQDNTIFADRVRLAFDTSFSGRDRLRTRLQARNLTSFTGTNGGGSTGTAMTRLGFDGDDANRVDLNRLEYRFPLNSQITAFIGGGSNDGLEFNDMIPTLSPFESAGQGSFTRFGRYSPIYRVGTGTGIALNMKLGKEFTTGDKFTLSLGYLVPTNVANNPATENGLFNGSNSAIAQLVFQASRNLGIGFTYARGFYTGGTGITGGTGSLFANSPFGANVDTSTDSFGVQLNWRVNPGIIVAGWANYISAKARGTTVSFASANGIPASGGTALNPVVRDGDEADIFGWSVGLAFPDLFKEGNLGGLIFGQPPKVTDNDFGINGATATAPRREDRSSSFHLEGFYRWRISDNVSVTPGLLVIFNPEGNSRNDTIYVGTVRTTFTF